MTCSEVREYLFAFLDSELDAPLSIELQRHLDHCAACAREAEIERLIRKKLETATAVAPASTGDLERSVRNVAAQRRPDGQREREVRRRSVPTRTARRAIAAVVVFGVMAGVWTVVRTWSHGETAVKFADLVADDLEHFLEEGEPLQFASADRAAVETWLREQTKLDVVLPDVPGERFELLGGRKCKINGRPAAFAMYSADGEPVSLVTVRADGAPLDGMTPVRHADRSHWVDRCKGRTIVACRRGAFVYATASRLTEEDLLGLMTGTMHESD